MCTHPPFYARCRRAYRLRTARLRSRRSESRSTMPATDGPAFVGVAGAPFTPDELRGAGRRSAVWTAFIDFSPPVPVSVMWPGDHRERELVRATWALGL